MADNKLEIILSADVDQATKNIQTFIKTLGIELKEGVSIYDAFDSKIKEVTKSLKAATDPKDVARLTAELKKVESAFSAIKTNDFSKGIGGVGKAASNATPALTNFGRVIQDAPFGIIGIANNIDPLLASLQSLSKQSGGAGGALKALGGALLGPAGIAIGVSAVTSALIAFGPEISAAIAGVSKFEQAQREAAESGAQAFAKATDSFNNFLRISTDSGNSVARQNDAFESANKLLDDYGLKINSLADFQKNGAQIGALYAQIKQEEAKATVLAAKAAEAYAKNVALGIKAEQGDISVLSDFSAGDLFKTLTGGASAFEAVTNASQGYANAVAKVNEEQTKYNKEAEKARKEIDGLILKMSSIAGVTEDFGKKTKITKQTADDLNKELGLNVVLLSEATKAGVGQTYELGQLALAIDKARQAQEKKNLADKAAALIAATSRNQTAPEDLAKKITQPQGISDKQQEAADAAKKNIDAIALATNNANAAFALLSPSIDQAFNALANGQNAADALQQALKRLIVDLIKAVVQAAVLAAIMNAIFPGSSAAQGGFAGIFKSLLGFGGRARANGGPVNSGGPYIVGESGPELFVPSSAGQIVPNMAFGGGGGQLQAVVSGNDLLFILNQAGMNRRNNFG